MSLQQAAREGNTAEVLARLEEGADVNQRLTVGVSAGARARGLAGGAGDGAPGTQTRPARFSGDGWVPRATGLAPAGRGVLEQLSVWRLHAPLRPWLPLAAFVHISSRSGGRGRPS